MSRTSRERRRLQWAETGCPPDSRRPHPALRFWRLMADNPPTTAEWLAYCRRTGLRQQYWYNGHWAYPPRPFIAPHAEPWGRETCFGYLRRLP